MTRVFLTIVLTGGIAAPAFAQAPAGSCKPVFDAMLKETITPHHTVTTQNGRQEPIEVISTADTTYVKTKDGWVKSPMSPKATLAQQQENIRDTTVASCKALADEVIDGKAASVYQAHYEQKDLGATDAKLWIARATGLSLRTDVTLQAGEKVSVVTRFDYDHFTAPPVK